jgi:thiosulfate dehydrogenase [quinone] large subunit
MSKDSVERGFVVFFRLVIGWTFLWAGFRQVFLTPDFTVASFLTHTKTFHDVFTVFMLPPVVEITSFLVKWGHLLIGLSLISGLLVRVSGTFGILLLGMYYFAHMDFPYIEAQTNLLIDYHIVYMGVTGYLIFRQAGHVWGLDGLVERMSFVVRHPRLALLVN